MGLNSKDLKAFAIQWLRFGKQCHICATEAGEFHSDAFGITDDFSIEIEVKISRSDLMNDFKKPKHGLYKALDSKNHRFFNIPNYFYYLIPYSLQFDAESLCKGTPYGIILSDTNQLSEGKFTVCKSPRMIHTNKPTEKLKKVVLFRMASELANYHLNFEKIIKQIEIGFNDTRKHLETLDSFTFKDRPEERKEITLSELPPPPPVDTLGSFASFMEE